MTDSHEQVLAELNDLANPLGFSVEFEGKLWKTAPTGPARCRDRYQAIEPGEIRAYLNDRAANRWWWWLDMSDESIVVENPLGPGTSSPTVRISSTVNPDQSYLVDGGVCGEMRTGEVHSFYARDSQLPPIGRWYR